LENGFQTLQVISNVASDCFVWNLKWIWGSIVNHLPPTGGLWEMIRVVSNF